MPWRASIDTVNAVPSGARLSAHHHRQAELADALLGERQADQAAPVLGHEVDRRGRHLLGRHAQIALVLAVLVVHQDHHLAGLDVGDGVLDRADLPARRLGGARNVVNMASSYSAGR